MTKRTSMYGRIAAMFSRVAAVGRLSAVAGIAFLVLTGANAAVVVDASGPDNLAIKGYDPVAYFTEQRPVLGSKQFEYKWMNATWRFESAAHRDAFAAKPEKYAPQYGGYSAMGIAEGAAADGDPSVWSMLDGKLYLNASESARKKWLVDIDGYIESANTKWPQLESGIAR